MNQKLKRQGFIGLAAIAALTFALPAHAQDEDEIKKNNAKGDTLTFNASDFVLPEGANLDRLLRKLPGVTYYSSGSVEMDGITIKEMTVETKSFFKNSISSITSRIPAYAIQYVKFYDYDQGKRMSIKLKKEYKKKCWAEFSAALGPDNRYSEKVFAMIDDKKLRMTIYGNVNDINDSRQPGQETEWTPAEAAKNQRTTQTGGFDYRKKEKKWDATGYLTFSRTNTESVTDINKINFIESGNTAQTSHAYGENKKMKIDTYHDFHTMLGPVDVHVKPKFQYNSGDNVTTTDASESRLQDASESGKPEGSESGKSEDSKSDTSAALLINDSRNIASTQSHSYTAGISASASIKFDNKRKQLKADIGGTNKGGREDKRTEQTVNYYDVSIDSTYYNSQRLFTRPIDYTEYYAKFSYLWLTSRTLSSVQYQYKHISQHEEMAETGTQNGNNSYQQRENDNYHEFTYKLQWGYINSLGVWNANLFLPVGLHSISRTYTRSDFDRTHTDRYWAFDAKNSYLQWRSNNLRHKLTLLFQSTSTRPEIEQTEEVTITTDAQNYYRGNSNLKAQWLMNGRLTYSYLSKDMRYELKMQVIRENTYDAIVSKLSYDRPSGRKLYTYDNANGNNNTKMRWILGMPLTSGSNLFLHNDVTYGIQQKVSLEETKNEDILSTLKKKATVRSIDDDLRLKWKTGEQVFTLRSRFRQSYTNSNGTISHPIDWEFGLLSHLHLPWDLDLSNNFNLYTRRKYTTKELNTNDFVWDARLVRTFLNDKLMVVLEGFDILKQLKHVEYTQSSSYISSKNTNVIPSYMMACVVYRLNHSSKKNKAGKHWY